MKKIALVGATLALVLAAGSASAATATKSDAGPSHGAFGLSVGVGNTINPGDFIVGGRYFITKDMAILAGAGLQLNDSGATANAKSTNFGLTGGFRKYLKTDDLAPFVGGQLAYASTRQNSAAGVAVDVSTFGIFAEGGAEYFLSKNFSFEGSVSVGYSSNDAKPAAGGTSVKSTTFGTSKGNLAVNFYF
jgi:hypothetical protein